MSMDEIKAQHEAVGGRFFLAMMAFYGLTIEDFLVTWHHTGGPDNERVEQVQFKLNSNRRVYGIPCFDCRFIPETGAIHE